MKLTSDQEKTYQEFNVGGGILPCPERGKIRVTGEDRVSFLHAMISNDVEGLPQHHGRYGTLLTANGRLVASFFFYRFEDSLLLDLDADIAPEVIETLSRFIIMEDVELQDTGSQTAHLSFQGKVGSAVLSAFLGDALPSQENEIRVYDRGEEILVTRRSWLGDPGHEALLASRGSAASQLLGIALDEGCPVVAPETREVLRVERGIPLLGQDMDGSVTPLEAGLQHAISFTKGCYIGQEVVAKATYVGGIPRSLHCLRLDGEETAQPGGDICDGLGKSVGRITSSVYSPRMGSPIALGYVRRGTIEKGTDLTVRNESGNSVSAQVVDRFRD